MSTPAKHRLSNIDVLEMSVVDKGANKRRWLVAKRDGEPDGEDDVKISAELTKVLGDLTDFLKKGVPANAEQAAVTKTALDELDKVAKAATAQVADLSKALGELKVTVEKQGETITSQAAEIKKGGEAQAAADKTIADLRGVVNEQAAIIAKARMAGVGNAGGDDGPEKKPHVLASRGEERWPVDMSAPRFRG